MKNSIFAFLTSAAILVFPAPSQSQGEATAVPFLLVPPAPEALGMGGGSASLPTTDAIATVVNPGQLGLFSLTNLFNASTFVYPHGAGMELLSEKPVLPSQEVTLGTWDLVIIEEN